MGFLADLQDQFKRSVTPMINWRSAGKGALDTFVKREPAVLMKSTVSGEFDRRYRNLRYTAISAAVFAALSLVSLVLASGLKDFFFSLMACLLFSMFYFRYSFMLWVCRTAWIRWGSLDHAVRAQGADFIRALSADPAELLPLPLPAKDTQVQGE